MRLARNYLFMILLLTACGGNSNTTNTEQESEEVHKHHHATDDTHEHTDKTPLAKQVNNSPSGKYTYKDGHIILTWERLAQVTFEEDYDESVQEYIMRPIFSDTLKTLDRQPVMIEGYVIPFEETGDETFIVLSSVPYLQCFFCGGAGPETVIDILPKNKLKRLKTDQKITFKGKLRLNADDLDYLNYILDDAELVK